MSLSPLFPNIKWAQQRNIVHVTLCVPDVKDTKINIESEKMTFHGTSLGSVYECTLDLTGKIDANMSKYKVE